MGSGFLIVCLAAVGCGGQSDPVGDTIPVSGTVNVNGKPLESGSVSFHPDESKGNSSAFVSVGNIENGNYKLSTRNKEGAPQGWYKVTIISNVPGDPKDEYSLPKSLVATKYTQLDKTPLTLEVKEGGDYDLDVSK